LQDAVDALLAGSQQDFPIGDERGCEALLRRQDLIEALRRNQPDQTVKSIAKPLPERISAHEPLQGAVEKMRNAQFSALPVFENGAVVGLLTMENVTELMMVRSAIRDASLQPEDLSQV